MIETAAAAKTETNIWKHAKASFKYAAFACLILSFLLHHTIMNFIIRNEEKKLKYFLKSISLTARAALKIFNIKINRIGEKGDISQRLIVSNHMSYLDVVILFKDFPSLFVTSTEIRDTFFLGDVCKLAGCFFVERRKAKRSITTKDLELKDMKHKFDMGFNIFLFPEGTSGDGSSVLPFKGTFFQLATDTNTNVVPICLKYTGENRDVPPWYGDMTFPDHLYRVCLEDKIEVTLNVLPEVAPDEKMALAKTCYEKISEAYA